MPSGAEGYRFEPCRGYSFFRRFGLPGRLFHCAGLGLGLVGYLSAIRQAAICSNGVNEMSNGQDVFGKTMILAVFPELYAILSFAATFLCLPPAV